MHAEYEIPEDELIYAGEVFPFHANVFALYGEQSGEDSDLPYLCALCGRKIANVDTCTWVEIVDGGIAREQTGQNYSVIDDEGYLGLWPVGKKCAKKLHPTIRIDVLS